LDQPLSYNIMIETLNLHMIIILNLHFKQMNTLGLGSDPVI